MQNFLLQNHAVTEHFCCILFMFYAQNAAALAQKDSDFGSDSLTSHNTKQHTVTKP